MKLNVYAEREGVRRLVGCIETAQAAGERFAYDETWLAAPDAQPLSLSLPLIEGPYSAKKARPYFDGLLPEGQARAAIAKAARVSSRSYVKLLAALGEECVGAVSFYASDGKPEEGYVPLAPGDLNALSREAYRGTTPLNRNARARMGVRCPIRNAVTVE